MLPDRGDDSLTLVKGFTQSSFSASRLQNVSGSLSDSAYKRA